MRRRKLSPEERDLWSRVAATTQAIHPVRPAPPDDLPAPQSTPKQKPPPPKPDLRDFRIGQSAPGFVLRQDLAPPLSERLAAGPVRMDRKAHQKMTRGRLEPEGRIDLHGMTLAQAHPELIRFILNAQSAGKRLVLVITGKGKRGLDEGPIPQRQGALRHQVPHWLHLPPLAAAVLQVTPAHQKHGGSGAYYVYMRRNR
ncbi:Smr/MutS family protein [Phaeovulum sp.]|uniref:Smr/MutS family protein n=1 Tax=Phaeovulum sp. TaxID=2934796 RepID=UPI0039E5658E